MQDITSYNCKQLIETVPFFVNADPNFVTDVITKLEFEMFQPGDVIIKADTKGDKMYFIQEGSPTSFTRLDECITAVLRLFNPIGIFTIKPRPLNLADGN